MIGYSFVRSYMKKIIVLIDIDAGSKGIVW
jgi:hypothetical protein